MLTGDYSCICYPMILGLGLTLTSQTASLMMSLKPP